MADGTYPALGECVGLRSARWDGDDRAADSGEHVIEGPCVLAGAVADHEPDGLVVADDQVPGSLGGPGTGGVGGDRGEVHSSGVDLDEEQHMEPPHGDGIDAEEVGRHQGVGLASNELAPARPGPVRGGLTSGIAQDLPHRRRGKTVSETAYLSMDASVAPGWVLCVEAQDQPTKLRWCGRAPGSGPRWLGPVAGDEVSVPADHGGRFHDQHHTGKPLPVERTREHGQDGPVRRGEPRPLDLSLQDENLMAKGEDLGVTLVTGYQQQSETGDQEPKQV